jgi:high-affinity iron transporter
VPVAVFVYWPRAWRPRGAAVARLQLTCAAVLAVAGIVLALAVPRTQPPAGPAPLTSGGTAQVVGATLVVGDLLLPLPAGQGRAEEHAGVQATTWTVTTTAAPAAAPASVTLDQLTTLSGGKLPVGLNPQQHPGPFDARWSGRQVTTVWVADGVLLDATREASEVVTVSGSGLQGPRTLTVDDPRDQWTVAPAHRDATAAALSGGDRSLWAVDLPVVLGVAALLFLAAGLRRRTAPTRSLAPAH